MAKVKENEVFELESSNTEVKVTPKKNYLENRRVIVKPIKEKYNTDYTQLHKEHIGKFQFPFCSTWLKLPFSEVHRGLYPLLTRDEQAFFEEKMYMQPGELSTLRTGMNPNDRDTYNFWFGFKVDLKGEEELKLNLADPLDNLRYRLLKIRPEVASSWEERLEHPAYRWALVDADYEEKVNTTTADMKIDAYAELSKIRSNKTKLLDILRALGKYYNTDTDEKVLYSEIGKIIETSAVGLNQITIKDFLRVVNDPDTVLRAIINTAIAKSIIVKSKYNFKYQNEILGRTIEDVVEFCKVPENNEVFQIIKTKTKE